MCPLSVQPLTPLWLVVSDFDYCSGCYHAHWQEHHGGRHRFVLRQYPTPNIVITRAMALLKKLTGDADPWKLEDRPAPDTTALQEDRDESDATTTEGMSRSWSWVECCISTEHH